MKKLCFALVLVMLFTLASCTKNDVPNDVITDTPVADEPVADEPVADEPVVDEPVADEPVVDEPVADEPVVDEPVVDEPVVDEPVADEPVADEPVVDEPVADEPVVDEPVVDEPVADEPVANEPVVDEPVANEPVADEPVVEPETPRTVKTFGIFSDIHNQTQPLTNVINNILKFTDNGKTLDGILMVGDIINTGKDSTPTYKMLANHKKYNQLKDEGKVAFAMGNHEFPLGATDEANCTLALNTFVNETGFDTEADTILGGYHFITCAPSNYNGKLTDDQQKFVMDAITNAMNDGTNKPVFLLIHYPFDETTGTSNNPYTDEFSDFIKSHPRLIVFSGHTHQALSDPRTIYQELGGATFVNTSTVHSGINFSHSLATTRHDKSSPSQALMMTIDDTTNVVTLKRFYITGGEPKYLEGGDWVLDINAMVEESKKEEVSTDVYKYTPDRALLSLPPYFPEEAKMTLNEALATEVKYTLPEARSSGTDENSTVGFYRLELFNTQTGELVEEQVIISDFFVKTKRHSFVRRFYELTPSTSYKIVATPITVWGIEAETSLTLEFTTSQSAE